jgi:Zn-dependent peptidase ImmA (M78 family)/transcriptional regulator with XRE-family HTH domain
MIVGARIQQGRELCGLTQTELSRQVGVDQSTIARLESGTMQPSPALLQSIALQTGLVPSFFRNSPSEHFPYGSLQFRAKSSVTAKERQQAYQYARTVFEVVESLISRLDPLAVRVASLDADPHTAARLTRSNLGLSPDTPIQNLTNDLERGGVIVVTLPVNLRGRDGFSGWAGHPQARPVVNLSTGVPGDRLRWTLAHELGELVLAPALPGRVKEKAANQFAAELLLPSEAMRRELVPPVTLLSVAKLKPRWRVSMQSLISRACDLELISERQQRYLYAQLTTRGWRLREPANLDVPVERPRGLRKMAELLYGDPVDAARLARDVNLSTRFIRELLEVQAMGPVRLDSAEIVAHPLKEAEDG